MSHAHHKAGGSGRPDEVAIEVGLLVGIADGDPDAFRALWERYGPPVFRICLAITGERQTAEDAAQETFLRIWRRAGTYDPARGVPAAWITTIARNVARTAAQPPQALRGLMDTSPRDNTELVVDRVWLGDALRRLSSQERVALELAYFADLSHAQVAARLGEPLGTVKARIRRALLRLADRVGER